MDDVELEFEEEALKAISRLAMERNTGARGLRSIIESVVMDLMYEIPSDDNISKCIITKDMVENHADAIIEYDEKKAAKKKDPVAKKRAQIERESV